MDYKREFDSKDYLNRYYLTAPCDSFFINEQIKAMNHPVLKGGSMIDIGVGPTVHTAMISSKRFNNIVLSDYVDSNRAEVNKWLNDDPHAHDWSRIINDIAALECEDPKTIVKRTREAVKGCIPVDVHNSSNVLEPNKFDGDFDCLLSSMCLTSACLEMDAFRKALENLNKLVKDNGFFIIMEILSRF